VRAYVRPGMRAVSKVYLIYKPVNRISQLLADGVVEVTDELTRFQGRWGQGQGRYKVRCAKLRDPISPGGLEGSQPNFITYVTEYDAKITNSRKVIRSEVNVKPRSRVKIRLRQLRNGSTNFEQILYKCSIAQLDELVRFSRSWRQSKGNSKVKYLTGLIAASRRISSTLGRRSIV